MTRRYGLNLLFGLGLLLAGGCATAAVGELTVGVSSLPMTLDPHYADARRNDALARHIFDRLIVPDHMQRFVPALAIAWQALDEHTWEFKLRQGVRFHDGSAFSADDVLFSFSRARGGDGLGEGFADYLHAKTIQKIDDHTVQVRSDMPDPLLPIEISRISIVSKVAAKGARPEDFDSGRAMIGTGPFRFVNRVGSGPIVLERNEAYWGHKPEWVRVNLLPIKTARARLAALQAGQIDVAEELPSDALAGLAEDPRFTLDQIVSNRLIYLQLDQARDNSPYVQVPAVQVSAEVVNPLRDSRVRAAISLAIDRQSLVATALHGSGQPTGQLLPDGFFGASPKLPVAEFDALQSEALLKDAGLTAGFELTLHSPDGRYLNAPQVAARVGEMLTQAGIRTTVITLPTQEYFRRATRGGKKGESEFSAMLLGWGTRTGEALSPLEALVHSFAPHLRLGLLNRGRYHNEQVDALITEAGRTVDEPLRQQLLRQATAIAIGEHALVPLYFQLNSWVSRAGLRYRARSDEATLAMEVYSE